MNDPFNLQRFVDAQRAVHDRALGELRAGRKATHWMWFVFPQLEGLGSSYMAQRFAIGSLDEARAYLAHPVLGARLIEGAQAVLGHPERTALQIFGAPDDAKFRSSMTLFEIADSVVAVFGRALDQLYGGMRDERTLERLGPQP